jgi:EAL domain-containing protein (putative c-di-GMP-specific phosphodiesterase class I)
MLKVSLDPAITASIRIFFQPIVCLDDLRPAYAEVLARAEAPDGSLAGPETIVDAMSNAEHSMRLTASIMRRTLDEYTALNLAQHDLAVAFNLPLDAMLHPELIERLDHIRASADVAPRHIRFELTERHPVHDLNAAGAVITRLREAGYGLALDDITPDMPNLPALMNMPIRAIKLDRSVVVSTRKTDQHFIQTMVANATANRQDIIAEGIETHKLRNSMRDLGVTHGQGFLFSHPLPAAAMQAFLQNATAG